MARLGGADVIVIRDVERGHHVAEARGVAIRKSERREALRNRGLLHLEAVLVGSR